MMDPEPAWTFERRPWGWGDVLALTAWTAAVVAFFWDAVSLRGALFYFDLSEINYPYRDFLAGEIRSGRFSRWHPGLYCGLPLFGESQAGYFHPLKYLFYPWLATWVALNLETVASVWLAGAAAYGWLRRHSGPVGALTGAGVFGLSGFVWAHLIHTSWINALPGIPLAFWALEVAWEGGRLRGVVLGAGSMACQVFAGQVQCALLTGLAILIYALYRASFERGPRPRGFVAGSAVILLGLGGAIAAVQWIPSKELLDRSPRAGGLTWEELTYGSWHPELLPTLLAREVYGTRARDTDWIDRYYPYHEMDISVGVVGLALAMLGAGAYRDRWVGFWLLLAGLGLLMMLGRFTFLFDAMHRIPVLGSSRIPVRYHLWVSIAVAALAAVGADRLARPGRVRWRGPVIAGIVLAVISLGIALYVYGSLWKLAGRWPTPDQRTRAGWLGAEVAWGLARSVASSAALLTILSLRRRVPRLTACLPLLVIAELCGAHWRDVPTIDPRYWTEPPPTAARLARDPELGRVLGIAGAMANAPGYASRPIDFFPSRDALAWNLAPVWGLRSSGGETPIYPRRILRFHEGARPGSGRFDVEGVTHLLSGGRPIAGLGEPEQVGAALIYRNPDAQPRARLMARPLYAVGEDDAAEKLATLGPAIRRRVLVEDPDRPLPEDAEVDPSGTASITLDEPERVEVVAESSGPSYLVLADTFDPGWSATLDGRPVAIRPAFVAFRAVYLPSGKHRVAFGYRPAGFAAGLALSAVGAIVGAALLIRPRRLATLGPDHGPSPWPRWWPALAWLVLLAIVIGSTVRITPEGSIGLQSRWVGRSHRFGWAGKSEPLPNRPLPRLR